MLLDGGDLDVRHRDLAAAEFFVELVFYVRVCGGLSVVLCVLDELALEKAAGIAVAQLFAPNISANFRPSMTRRARRVPAPRGPKGMRQASPLAGHGPLTRGFARMILTVGLPPGTHG